MYLPYILVQHQRIEHLIPGRANRGWKGETCRVVNRTSGLCTARDWGHKNRIYQVCSVQSRKVDGTFSKDALPTFTWYGFQMAQRGGSYSFAGSRNGLEAERDGRLRAVVRIVAGVCAQGPTPFVAMCNSTLRVDVAWTPQ